LLKLFERHTKGRIEIAQVPTVADLRARRLEMTRAALRETILAGDLDHFRVCVESLAQEHDLMAIALAAVKLAHQASGGDKDGEDDQDERDFAPPAPATARQSAGAEPREARHRGSREERQREPARPSGPTARVYVGAGRNVGIRPQDLVGAFANESGIEGRRIGAIEIADKYSIVELPEEALDNVVAAMKKAMIKGRKVTIRRFIEKGEARSA
jgi:ATP-dependent RNA helicase DeaD